MADGILVIFYTCFMDAFTHNLVANISFSEFEDGGGNDFLNYDKHP